VLLCFCVGAVALAEEYSAEMVSRAKGMTVTSKMYSAGNKWRTETRQGGRNMVSILRLDKKLMWSLMPEQKMYMEMKLSEERTVGMTEKMPGEVQRKFLGREKVNGIDCDKYEVTYTLKETGKRETIYQWVSRDKMPIKTAAKDGSWSTEIKSFKKGRQPANLFEIPAGYKKQVVPAMMPGKGKLPVDYQKMLKMMKNR
jgi:hypothetical protein